jgi:hypothetical protein
MKEKYHFFLISVLLIISISLSSGCAPSEEAIQAAIAKTQTAAPTNTPTITPTSSPTLTPTPIVYDGEWIGKTEQGYPVSFNIENNELVKFYINYGNVAVGCSIEIDYDIKNDPREVKPKLENGRYEFISDSDKLMIELIGIFNPSGKASGTFKARTKQCDNVNTTWEVSRK